MLWAHNKRSPLAIALYVPLAVWWVVLQPVAWQATEQSVYLVGAVGAALLLLAEAHHPGDPMGVPFRFWGTAVSAGVLVPLGFTEFIRELQFPHGSGVVTGLTILIVGTIGVAALARFHSARSAPRDSDHRRLTAFASRQWFPVMLLALMAFLALWNSNVAPAEPKYYHGVLDRWTPDVLLPTLMTNIAMVALAIHLMRVGLNEDRGRPFTFGVLLFLLWAVLRYIDLFAGVGGMLGAAVMFLFCGMALFVVARFWQSRKETPHV